MEKNNQKQMFDFGLFFHNYLNVAKRLFWIPLLLAAAIGAIKFLVVRQQYTPSYESKAVFAVSSNYAATTDIGTYTYYYDTAAAQNLASTFQYVLQTDAARQLTYQKLHTTYLEATVTATSIAESNLFVMSSTGKDPQKVYDVLCAIIEIYPQAASRILGNITIQLLEEPVVATSPTNPYAPLMPTVKYALIGFVLGLLVLAVFAFMRKVVHTESDLRQLINVPCLSFLPNVRFKARSNASNQNILITNPHVSQAYLESVRALRFRLKKELEKQPGKVIMVTSTLPSEGKTTVSANLALSLAEQSNRVVLVDADLRKQALKQAFGIETPSEGLPELIAGKRSEIHPIAVPGSSLLLISGDKIADQPQAFLSSARMEKIISSLREQMDYVIIDMPPCSFLSDAATLADSVDSVLYVVRQDFANCSLILNSIQSLSNTDVHFIGCVLNNTEAGTTRYGYGNRYGYSTQYGSYYGYDGYGYGHKDETEDNEQKPYVK